MMLMIENLRNSIKEMITDVDWMEDETKTFARNKVIKYRQILQTLAKTLSTK